jgi:hypothetical protein
MKKKKERKKEKKEKKEKKGGNVSHYVLVNCHQKRWAVCRQNKDRQALIIYRAAGTTRILV